jgi:hypothetical protein
MSWECQWFQSVIMKMILATYHPYI